MPEDIDYDDIADKLKRAYLAVEPQLQKVNAQFISITFAEFNQKFGIDVHFNDRNFNKLKRRLDSRGVKLGETQDENRIYWAVTKD